jgi:hypothetical protein
MNHAFTPTGGNARSICRLFIREEILSALGPLDLDRLRTEANFS